MKFLFLGKNNPPNSDIYIKRHDHQLDAQILANRAAALSLLNNNINKLCLLKQVHSNKVQVVRDAFEFNFEPEADALVTSTKGLALGIITADCVPILLGDEINGVIGAIHAGWRGAKSNIIANTVETMVELGADLENITAHIGPCIRKSSYEVGEEFFAHFLLESEKNHQFFTPGNKSHYYFDLAAYVKKKLSIEKINKINDCNIDTLTNQAYYSYRYCKLHNIPYVQNNISLIMMDE
jgi:YfiH family protein